MRTSHPLLLLLSFTLYAMATPAQGLPGPSSAQLSPQAAYQEAIHPLELTRHNIANWSDVELAAMNVAVAKAKADCSARHPESYTGTDLVDLARLCALGQDWNDVVAAASRYITSPFSPKPRLADAYIAQTEAKLRLKQEPAALGSALAMLAAVPYTSDVGDCVDEALAYMRFVHTADALTLAQARQPLLLSALHAIAAAASPTSASDLAPPASIAPNTTAIHELYAAGMLLPALQQLAARPAESRASVAALDAVLPPTLSSDDLLLVERQRRRFALLGKPLAGIVPLSSLSMPADVLPTLPAHGAITAMLLFPDWCAQCIAMAPHLPPTVFTVEGHSAYVYALLAETVPARRPGAKLTNSAFDPAYAASMMAETPTVTVSPAALSRFEADDFPMLLLTDAAGVLRVIQAVSAQDVKPGGDVDAAIALVGKNFAAVVSPSTSAQSPPRGH